MYRKVALALLLVVGFVLGRATRRLSPLPAIDAAGYAPLTVEQEDRHFAAVVAEWNAYVVAHSGWVPADVRSVFATLPEVDGYDEVRQYSFQVPPRLNPDLSQNVKRAVFSRVKENPYVMWTCFADGAWGRFSLSVASSGGSYDTDDWASAMKNAGYPMFFRNARDEDEWIANNKERIVWDAGRRMYVVCMEATRSPAATRQTDPTLGGGQ